MEQSQSIAYTDNSVIYKLRNKIKDLVSPIINKVELSQKQAMRRDEHNVRVSSGVKYQLKFRGSGFENVSAVEARLGRIGSDDYMNQKLDLPVVWMSFKEEKPIEFFEVIQSADNEGSPSVESLKSDPISPNSTNSNITSGSQQSLKVVFSLKKFSHIKKLDKSLPPAKKITFVLSIQFAQCQSEARVFFKFSTRSKAESSKEWKLDKVLDSEQHPQFIQLLEPTLHSPTSCLSDSLVKEDTQYLSENEESSTFTSSKCSEPLLFSNQYQDLHALNLPNYIQGQAPPQIYIDQHGFTVPDLGMNQMSRNVSPQSQLPSQFIPMNPTLHHQLGQQQLNQHLNMQVNQFNMQLQQQMQLQLNPTNMQWNEQIPQDNHHIREKPETSRKRSRDSFTQEFVDTFLQKKPKINIPEDQLDTLSQEEGPARKPHNIQGYGSFYCLKAPVYVYFGSTQGKVEQIQKDTIFINVPYHQATPRPVNVTLQNSERAPISSFAQYKFIELEDKDEADTTQVQNSQSSESTSPNFLFQDFDFNFSIESLLDTENLGTQFMGIDSIGQSFLHHVAYIGHSRLLLKLLLEGFSPGYKDFLGRTPYHISCGKGNTGSAKILLAFGSAALAIDEDIYGMTGTDIAKSFGHDQLVESIKKFVTLSNIRNPFIDDVELFCENYTEAKQKTPWIYNKDGEEVDEEESELTPVELENKQLRQEVEIARRKLSLVQIATRQRVISKLRAESQNRRISREIEALLPEIEDEELPIPELDKELLTNTKGSKK